MPTPEPTSIRHQKPTPAWVIIGLFTSSLIVLLQCTLYFLSSNVFAAFIVSLTYTSCLLLACVLSLTGHLLVRRFPSLDRFLNINVDLQSVGDRMQRMTSVRRNRCWDIEAGQAPPPYVHHRHMDSNSSAGTMGTVGSLSNVHPALRPDVRRVQLRDLRVSRHSEEEDGREPMSPLVENAEAHAGTQEEEEEDGGSRTTEHRRRSASVSSPPPPVREFYNPNPAIPRPRSSIAF